MYLNYVDVIIIRVSPNVDYLKPDHNRDSAKRVCMAHKHAQFEMQFTVLFCRIFNGLDPLLGGGNP